MKTSPENVFPTQYSVLKAEAVGHHIKIKYGIPVASCKLLIHNVSDAYVLEADGVKYIFKIYRDSHRKEQEIRAEAELLTLYKKNGACVAYTLPDLEGDMLTAFNVAEGIRFGMLFVYAKGTPVYDLSDTQLQLLGREMAALHNVSARVQLKNYRKEYTVDSTLIHPLKVIQPAFVNLTDEYTYLTETTERVLEHMAQLPLQDFSTGYCHYDFLPKNFHFTEDEALTFFDFDFAGKGYLINDITSFYIHYFFDVLTGKKTRCEADRCFKVFLDSYRKVKPVSNEELKSMQLFGYGFFMFYFGFHQENFDDWSNSFFTERFIKERITIIIKWMEYADITNVIKLF